MPGPRSSPRRLFVFFKKIRQNSEMPFTENIISYLKKYAYSGSLIFYLNVGGIGAFSIYQFQNALKWVEHTYQVVAQIERVSTFFERAETSQRGFLLTAQKDYLAAYKDSIEELKKSAEFLTFLVSDNPAQTKYAVRNQQLIMQRIEILGSRIQDKEKNQSEVKTAGLGPTGLGNEVTKTFRQNLASMRGEELLLLEQRKNRKNKIILITSIIALFAFIFAFGFNLISRMLLKRESDEHLTEASMLNLIIDGMSEGVISVDEHRKRTYANKAAQKYISDVGKNVSEDDRAKNFDIYNPETLKLLDNSELPLTNALQGRSTDELEVILKNENIPDGILLSISGMPLRNSYGSVIGAITVYRDISKRKALELEWEKARVLATEASQLKSEFLANMSHEIRTPMNGIMGMASLLLDSPMTSQQFEFTGIIKKSAEALLILINGILDHSKIEAGKLILNFNYVDLYELMNDSVELLRFYATEKKIEFNLVIDFENDLSAYVDAGRFRQVLVNLLSNAIKFTEQGHVTLKVTTLSQQPNSHRFRFAVEDTGVGLTKAEINSLFSSYSQTTFGMEKGGAGLGLSISQQLVRLMGSEIHITSEKNRGATFWFEMEMQTSQAEFCKIPEKKISSDFFKGHVLIVEDQQINQIVITNLLNRLGLTTDVANNGHEALLKYEAHEYDLIFMDCRMPVMDGYEAAEKIRIHTKNTAASIPIVALSAEGHSGDRKRCLVVGMNNFLRKPVQTNELLSILKKYLKFTPASVDFTVLEQLEPYSSAEQDLVQIMIYHYNNDYPKLLESLNKAEKEKNLTLFTEGAHALKSVSTALGLTYVGEICQWLEDVEVFSDQVKLKLKSLDHEIHNGLVQVTERKSRKV